ARRQRRRQDHHHLHAHGARGADLGRGARVRRRHGARAPQGAAPHELRKPLRGRADAADGAAEPRRVRQALRRARPQGAHRRGGGGVQAGRAAGPALRQAVGRAEDARQPRQGSHQRAGSAVARRAHCLARPRHRRLGAHQARRLLPRPRRHRRPRVAQHGRGRAAGRPRADAGEGPHHRRRDAGGAGGALRPRQSRGGVPRHRPPRRGGRGGHRGAAMTSQARPGARSPILHEQTTLAASARRIYGQVLRYWYVIRSSWPRTAELIYWPLVQMLMWGFLQTYLAQTASFAAKAAGLFIGAVLLWDVLVRSQLGFAVAFLEEVWSRNLGHLMMSPLRPAELVAALIAVSLIKLLVAMIPVAALAYVFFSFNVLSLGLAFAAFFANLVIMSWSLGLVSTGVVLRWGLGAESFAWLIVFVFLPLCCVYYPVSTLPAWLQWVALALPPTYVFEGLRAVVLEGAFVGHLMVKALALNAVYFLAGCAVFAYFLESARASGTLVQMGE